MVYLGEQKKAKIQAAVNPSPDIDVRSWNYGASSRLRTSRITTGQTMSVSVHLNYEDNEKEYLEKLKHFFINTTGQELESYSLLAIKKEENSHVVCSIYSIGMPEIRNYSFKNPQLGVEFRITPNAYNRQGDPTGNLITSNDNQWF